MDFCYLSGQQVRPRFLCKGPGVSASSWLPLPLDYKTWTHAGARDVACYTCMLHLLRNSTQLADLLPGKSNSCCSVSLKKRSFISFTCEDELFWSGNGNFYDSKTVLVEEDAVYRLRLFEFPVGWAELFSSFSAGELLWWWGGGQGLIVGEGHFVVLPKMEVALVFCTFVALSLFCLSRWLNKVRVGSESSELCILVEDCCGKLVWGKRT